MLSSNPIAGTLQQLAVWTGELDSTGEWPARQFQLLAESSVLGWVIPREFGGSAVSSAELVTGYVQLAEACLTTAFILTQRNGACQRIAGSQNETLKAELLPRLVKGEQFATVGISHLTTSRQHWGNPAVIVEEVAGGYRFHGEVPWVTGAPHAQHVVTGGTLVDGRQVLAAIPTEIPGVIVHPPAKLLALGASHTGSITLEGAIVPERFLLAGPIEQVMKQGIGAGTGSLSTSALALGLSRMAIAKLKDEVRQRPELFEIVEPLSADSEHLAELLDAAASATATHENPDITPEALRTRANSLVLRTTQVLLGASKGAGFVAGHPAERAVRESMFFLVWSCPQLVLAASLRELSQRP